MRIVVGIDERADAEELLSRVRQLTRFIEAQVLLLNVVDRPTPAADEAAEEAERFGELAPSESFDRLLNAHIWGSISLVIEPRAPDESVAETIARVCRDREGDLVVVASRRAGSSELGSVARALLRISPCPVVVVRTGDATANG